MTARGALSRGIVKMNSTLATTDSYLRLLLSYYTGVMRPRISGSTGWPRVLAECENEEGQREGVCLQVRHRLLSMTRYHT